MHIYIPAGLLYIQFIFQVIFLYISSYIYSSIIPSWTEVSLYRNNLCHDFKVLRLLFGIWWHLVGKVTSCTAEELKGEPESET